PSSDSCYSHIPTTLSSPLFPYTTLFRSGASDQVHAGAATATGRPTAIRLPSESLNHATLFPPRSAMPLTVLSPGVSYSSNLTPLDRKSTRLNSSHGSISYAVFCLKKKKN